MAEPLTGGDVDPAKVQSRRTFIKGVIAAGAVATTASYLFRGGGALLGRQSLPGSVERLITLNVNGQSRRVDLSQPTSQQTAKEH